MDSSALVTLKAGQIAPAGDVLRMLLEDKRSENTRRAYRADLVDFFGCDPDPERVEAFLAKGTADMAYCLNAYKAGLIERGLSESTINRRLSAVKSLIKFARRLGHSEVDPVGLVDNERVRTYRDTTGISTAAMGRILRQPDTSTVKGKRDSAILRLLWENGLRRAELVRLDVSDFHLEARELWIIGKGRGTQRERIELSRRLSDTILAYLAADRRLEAREGPLFCSCDRRAGRGDRLTSDGLYFLVNDYARRAGISKKISPHRIRHSAITAALDATRGDVRTVQRFSRHSKLDTLLIYDDNRRNVQADVTALLSELV